MFVEIVIALALSFILLQGYRVLRGAKAGGETIATDVVLGIGAVAVMVLWLRVLSTALVA